MAILRVKSGPQKGSVFEIEGDSVVLGREAGGQVQILDQGISRQHAEIFRIGEMYFIQDLKSRNGTYVNDQRISEEILRIGDQIAVGNTVLVFEDRLAMRRDAEKIFTPEAAPAPQSPAPTTTPISARRRSFRAERPRSPRSPSPSAISTSFSTSRT